jgi:hypothetical protein
VTVIVGNNLRYEGESSFIAVSDSRMIQCTDSTPKASNEIQTTSVNVKDK